MDVGLVLLLAGFMIGGPWFIDACRRRYGDAVTLRTLFDDRFVMVFHPALVKELFQGPGEQLRAGEANAMLGPVVGERSELLLDGTEHLRHRRLLLGPATNLDAHYSAFGRLVEGMEVLEAFEKEPLDGETPKRRIEVIEAVIE